MNMTTTKTDFHGNTIGGYGDDVRQYISNVLHLPIEKVTDDILYYIETNYYNFWYYSVNTDDYDDVWGQFSGIENEIKQHALPLISNDETYI
jgi:hypothetical protein